MQEYLLCLLIVFKFIIIYFTLIEHFLGHLLDTSGLKDKDECIIIWTVYNHVFYCFVEPIYFNLFSNEKVTAWFTLEEKNWNDIFI